jgi:choline dehydrogenase
LGIPVVADRPGVGAHLLDHPLLMRAGRDGGTHAVTPEAASTAPSWFRRMIKARSRGAAEEIDLHVYHFQGLDEARGVWATWCDVSLQHARSRGCARLTAPDPTAALAIDHGYFADPADLEAMCDGVELVARLLAAAPLAAVLAPAPGDRVTDWRDRDELRAWVRDRAGTTFHPSGTCRMGPTGDPGAVVDHAGRVHGVAGLRVADASVFPTIPRANLHCTVVAVAEKLADAIRRDAPA